MLPVNEVKIGLYGMFFYRMNRNLTLFLHSGEIIVSSNRHTTIQKQVADEFEVYTTRE